MRCSFRISGGIWRDNILGPFVGGLFEFKLQNNSILRTFAVFVSCTCSSYSNVISPSQVTTAF